MKPHDDFKRKLRSYDRPVLEAALVMLALGNPDVPGLVENAANYWNTAHFSKRKERDGQAATHPAK